MAIEVSPADLFDMAELSGAMTPLTWLVAREMHAGGDVWAVRRDGELIALSGLYPLGDGVGEAWFNIKPGRSGDMLPIVRQIRLTLQGTAYREIVVFCATAAGKRIAKAAGFRFFAETDIGEVWKL